MFEDYISNLNDRLSDFDSRFWNPIQATRQNVEELIDDSLIAPAYRTRQVYVNFIEKITEIGNKRTSFVENIRNIEQTINENSNTINQDWTEIEQIINNNTRLLDEAMAQAEEFLKL
ncbi:TPA: hypothetical protein ACGWER_001743 [Streptococcus agalactiae]|nr:hypothetical protein [Streptococcus agalactiae]HEO2267391.1 hypothetical protein [Streptococcus agalactiae]HEO7770317.1 hypothetical protein [Streptococcus agalactiae]